MTAATPATVPLSVLDRSRTRQGQDTARALRDTVALARHAERLGYHRFWVSEHHGVPGVAGSAPTVLAAAVAAATERIRVGTGGVMLPNHRPMVVAEQFGVLAALHPGRIDMGLGRSVGFTDGVRRALGRAKDDADRFEEQLAELLGWFTGTQRSYPGVHARPAEGRPVPAYVLATGAGARIAATAGLPLVIGSVRGEERMLAAIDDYRAAFRPSDQLAAPYVIVSGTVAVAATTEAARRLLVPEAWAAAHTRTHGEFPPLAPADEILARTMTPRERAAFEEAMAGHIAGTPDQALDALNGLVARTGADEFLLTTSTYDTGELLESYRLLAAAAGLSG
ncbi:MULTISPECIES: MsnO8 family LLM class oxidoreductase [Streptomycetaceae]|uniref:Oxygenase n=1 Tax=Streptantibioticus cattleyicolor (strain ATCC 35852 / DSM 46488 / JCM 4925 / NBRC 14057 / NRRL 8057) TaxID=1003195 RepID=F8K1F4_STREN|nr:MsnO8 family LLM class oxidoreductase [Streptantibioticus cattleyicolor]AEW97450.1 oxygenase [Streptantibioticus cattleyicolor NRRL 8057 = DSM 46488]MYS61886.1 MsnO8 family LLM class oxidoreductase [Streptomyces sp. SID5468]CCB77769.1 Oxygenase [Streptantibioticus cattleyicolor NRRL 8057 = DSM 46488]